MQEKIKHGKQTAIVHFPNEWIEDARRTESGLIIAHGKWVSDKDLYYIPQKCKIESIEHEFFKAGDTVYIDYIVFAGNDAPTKGASRSLLNFDDHIYFVWHREIFLKIEDGKLIPREDLIICRRIKQEIKSDLSVIHEIDTSKSGFPARVIAINPNEKDLAVNDIVFCEPNADYNKNRIEGEFLWIIEKERILGKFISS